MNGLFSLRRVFSWGSVGFCEVPWILREFLVGLMGPVTRRTMLWTLGSAPPFPAFIRPVIYCPALSALRFIYLSRRETTQGSSCGGGGIGSSYL